MHYIDLHGPAPQFLLPYVSRIATEVKARCQAEGLSPVPMVIFAKGAHYALEKLAATECVGALQWARVCAVTLTVYWVGVVLFSHSVLDWRSSLYFRQVTK